MSDAPENVATVYSINANPRFRHVDPVQAMQQVIDQVDRDRLESAPGRVRHGACGPEFAAFLAAYRPDWDAASIDRQLVACVTAGLAWPAIVRETVLLANSQDSDVADLVHIRERHTREQRYRHL